jgi:ribosomal protein S27AE
VNEQSKKCPRCGETKPIAGHFYVGKSGPAGYCIVCTKAKAVEWQKRGLDTAAILVKAAL